MFCSFGRLVAIAVIENNILDSEMFIGIFSWEFSITFEQSYRFPFLRNDYQICSVVGKLL